MKLSHYALQPYIYIYMYMYIKRQPSHLVVLSENIYMYQYFLLRIITEDSGQTDRFARQNLKFTIQMSEDQRLFAGLLYREVLRKCGALRFEGHVL